MFSTVVEAAIDADKSGIFTVEGAAAPELADVGSQWDALFNSKWEAAADGTAKVDEACGEQQLQQVTEEHAQLVTQPPPGFVLSGPPQNHSQHNNYMAVHRKWEAKGQVNGHCVYRSVIGEGCYAR
jgi:hypothetical protein